MGRGRAKAKQTKVARELKYSSHAPDLDALRAELISGGSPAPAVTAPADDDEVDLDDELDEDDDIPAYDGRDVAEGGRRR